MNAFRFGLQKVLDWRDAALELEEARFKQQAAALAGLERARADLETTTLRMEIEVRNRSSITGSDLEALSAFRAQMQVRKKQLATRHAECRQKLLEQQNAMLKARRQCRLLERLRDRRFTEWQLAANKELEDAAAESFLARWAREK
jgi:flagellar export protein FliJ